MKNSSFSCGFVTFDKVESADKAISDVSRALSLYTAFLFLGGSKLSYYSNYTGIFLTLVSYFS